MSYHKEFIKNGERLNGRKLSELRVPEVDIGQNGELTISAGDTKIFIKISSEISKPYDDKPNEGILIINNDIDNDILSRIVEKSIRKSNALDLESLVISTGKICWIIKIDLNILNFDGNLIDYCILGIMINLLLYKLPNYDIVDNSIKLYNLDEKAPISLSILHIPICFTISFYNPSTIEMNLKSDEVFEISLFDADKQEEDLRDSYMVITLNSNKEIIQLSKLGGIPINSVEVLKLCEICYDKAKEMTQWIKDVVKKEEEKTSDRVKMLAAVDQR
ncbi:exosome complex component Rrp45p [[Candida] jaroonii]|uniref:Exosome complex component Rrp45p n=1 Tax=[Candida] jaroonii TaxID=467808 RepID=A0ACA9Y2P2_9ASCO|nr:exosome complex component Rrp45p [[Candida] jaroonii]